MTAPGLRFALVASALSSCAPPIARDAIRTGPAQKLSRMKPEVVETSAPMMPDWTSANEHDRASARIAFVGQSIAPTLDAAKERATRDLFSAIASFVSVDVSSALEAVEESSRGSGGPSESQRVREETRAHAAAELRGLSPDAFYWERFVESPLVPESTGFQYWVHALVPKSEIARARQRKQSAREKSSGRRTIALLPFEPELSEEQGPEFLGSGLAEDLARELAADPKVRVSDLGLVRSVLPRPGEQVTDAETLERVEDALMPDLIVRGAYQRHRDRLRVTVLVHDTHGAKSAVVAVRSVERPYLEAPKVGGELASIVKAAAAPTATLAAPSDRGADKEGGPAGDSWAARAVKKLHRAELRRELAAFEAYHRAYAFFESGANDRALEEITRSIEARPDFSPAFMRLGRVLERLGRYARLPPAASLRAQRIADPLVCSARALGAIGDARRFLEEHAARLMSPRSERTSEAGAPWWTDETESVEAVLLRVLSNADFAATSPASAAGEAGRKSLVPSSALEAYARALDLAARGADLRAELDAALAIADLAARVDRRIEAMALYRRVEAAAEASSDVHHSSLAVFGQAQLSRQVGRLADAKAQLGRALLLRAALAEKPYVLEIDNELAGVSAELGEYAAAEAYYRAAWRLAEELDIDYLRAVLSNNLGVLEYDQGRIPDAEAKFHAAYGALVNLQEAEGKIASGLNLAYITAVRGEPDDARTVLLDLERVVGTTGQEGRLAEFHAKSGWLALARHDTRAAMTDLAISYLLFRALGRSAQAGRLQIDLLATDYSDGPTDRARLDCIKNLYWQLGAQVFERPRLDPGVRTIATAPLGAVAEPDLVLALDAAAISAMSPWVPPYIMAVERVEPPSIPIWQPPSMPRARSEEEIREDETRRAPEPSVRPLSQPAPPRSVERERVPVEESVAVSGAEPSRAAPPPVERASQVQKQAEYERILGAFTADADVLVFLDPESLEAVRDRPASEIAFKMLTALDGQFRARGLVRAAAIAEVDGGALAWFQGDPREAYERMMRAHETFARTGDALGLAHTYEWLGYFFRQSFAPSLAETHLQMAYALFDRLGDSTSAERVLRYGR
jgi:tetratricopeptide (TPR) repeat protein/TolB-like protein